MSTSDQKNGPSGLQQDTLSRDRYATITCPSCQSALRVKAHITAAAPCPICQHPLRYDPPTSEPEAPAFVPKPTITPDSPLIVKPEPGAPKPTVGSKVCAFNEFLNSPLGMALSWLIVALLVAACAVLFIQWDKERAQRSLRMETIESERPTTSRPVKHSSVPLLPDEPAPLDPLKLPE
ncbi:MAG: hypothetical protein OSA48_04875 [Akkermansiaceae bacterium]|nr:hypothetical protein [Akkermansiaceae bacterium]